MLSGDLKHGFLRLSRDRSFAVAYVLMLAIGVGATAAVFSIWNGMLLRPRPYTEPDRLVTLHEHYEGVESNELSLSNVAYYALQDRGPATVLRSLAAYRVGDYTVAVQGVPARVSGALASEGLFSVLGVAPALGRGFSRSSDSPLEVIVSDTFWRAQFRAQTAVIGQSFVVDGIPHTIVGIAPAGFYFPVKSVRFWIRWSVERPIGSNPNVILFVAVARLAKDASATQAAAESTVKLRSLGRTVLGQQVAFGSAGAPTIRAVRLLDAEALEFGPALRFLTWGAAVLLAIVSANLMNLSLSQGIRRQRELALRVALGASRATLLRQLLVETWLLLVVGALGGGAVAAGIIWTTQVYGPPDLPRLAEIQLDPVTLVFGVSLAAIVSTATTLVPALRLTRADQLVDETRSADTSLSAPCTRRNGRLQSTLVILEAACATAAIVASVLLGRSLASLIAVDVGYTIDHVLALRIFIPGGDTEDVRRWHVTTELLNRLRTSPDVVAAGASNMLPLDPANFSAGFSVPGDYRRAMPVNVAPRVAVSQRYAVTPGYAEAVGLRLVNGRFFRGSDADSRRAMWLVNEEFARLYLPPHPVGMVFPWTVDDADADLEIVGIVHNTLKSGPAASPQPEFYDILKNGIWGDAKLVVRVKGDPATFAPTALALVRRLAPDAAVDAKPLAQQLGNALARPRFLSTAATALAFLGSVLASGGLFAVLLRTVVQRRRELAIRLALGASTNGIVGMILRESVSRTSLGILLGLAVCAGLSRFMTVLLFGISPLDPASLIAPAVILLPVTVLVTIPVALNAIAANPNQLLRSE